MQSYDDIISFVYSDNGAYFFKRLYQEVEQMRRGSLPLTGSHQIEELDMTLSDALNLAVSAVFAIQTEFLEKDHRRDFDEWKKNHRQEEMDYQTWIHKSLVYQLDHLKLTDINAILTDLKEDSGEQEPRIELKRRQQKKKRRFFGKH